jgi:hypothetical protein
MFRTCPVDHSSRPGWLIAAPNETRDWMFGPEHGSGRHGTHHLLIPMPKLPKPALMTPEERNQEVAEIFARALLRIHFPEAAPATPPVEDQPQSTAMEPCKQN